MTNRKQERMSRNVPTSVTVDTRADEVCYYVLYHAHVLDLGSQVSHVVASLPYRICKQYLIVGLDAGDNLI